ncbi:hypothetical protein PGTUg99_030169 [Puccinia graminis f. sp. tritici]|uniref:Glycosyl transferase CAP10 domain-containing protein n=1 Tax=Puccinia graminis f. sp. tritici TaxID=56615 RepID=A0A5B0SQH2_PUCGR|nr:hypothetical protein PGTUg99_030169 [Puccinia graminis f. sp. tritici]
MARYHLIVPPRPHTLLTCLIFVGTLGLLFYLPFIKIQANTCTPTFRLPTRQTFFATENGLIVFATPIRNNTKIKHPIESLIANAKTEWDQMLQRQSKTLAMAVQEYQRRNNQRLPPKGFERWWQFAVDNQVGLVDEYDQISKDLEPFWAIEPSRLRKLSNQLQTKQNDRRLIFQVDSEGKVNRTGAFGASARAKDLSNLMESYQKYSVNAMKPFTMVIGADDQAEIKTTWRERSRLLELSKRHEFIEEAEDVQLSETHSPNDDCPPDSSPRSLGKGYSSFVFDHLQSMDICSSLEQVPIHGSLVNRHHSPFQPITPLFSFSKTSLDSDIRVTPLEQYQSTYGDVYDWDDPRRIGKAFWRGSTTGVSNNENPSWKESHRLRLHQLTRPAKERKQLIDGSHVDLAKVNSEWFDIEFVGKPIQCEPPACQELKDMINFQEWVGQEQANLYKYALDVDGNGWSGRFHKLLSSNRVVIKVSPTTLFSFNGSLIFIRSAMIASQNTIFPEWYADRIQPWYHYVPVKTDYSDLHDIIHYLKTRDDLAKQIAQNGLDYSQRYWRTQDMAAYMFRLSLEWSRLYNRETCDPSMENHHCESYDFEYPDPVTQTYQNNFAKMVLTSSRRIVSQGSSILVLLEPLLFKVKFRQYLEVKID